MGKKNNLLELLENKSPKLKEESEEVSTQPQREVALLLTEIEWLVLASIVEASDFMLKESYHDAQENGTQDEVRLMIDLMAIRESIFLKIENTIEDEGIHRVEGFNVF